MKIPGRFLKLAAALALAFNSLSVLGNGEVDFDESLRQFQKLNLSLIRDTEVTETERLSELFEYLETTGLKQFYDSPHALENSDFEPLLLMAMDLFYIDPREKFVRYMDGLLRELSNRAQRPEEWIGRVYYAWLSTRNLGAARQFKQKFSGHALPPVPSIDIDSEVLNGPSFLRADKETENHFNSEPFDVSDKDVVIIFDPFGCAFSLMWMEHVMNDEVWNQFVSEHSLLLMPQGQPLSYQNIVSWMDRTGLDLAVSYDNSHWDFVDNWAVPKFYFFEEGEVVHAVFGWTDETRSALEKIISEWD